MKIVPLGKVQTAIENAVLIEANTSGEYQVLESGSLLCTEDRKVLGVVSETLGRVENPLYTVMYKSAEEAQERGMVKDMLVYYVEAHSTFVFTQPLKGMKGSDASNFHDEEVAEDEIEFSDDEAEAEYKRKLKQKRQERKEAKEGGPARGKKGPPGPSKLSHTELNYDDGAAEDGYTPLSRPKNLHEMMGAREAPVEGTERGAPGFRGGRGRGRGADRGGRGGRGRGGAGRGGSWDRDQDHRAHHQQNGNTSQYGQQAAPPQTQPPAPYGQPAYQQPQPAYGMPQPFAGYPQYPQQQQPQFGQGQAPAPFPFQFPFQQAFAQPNPFQTVPPGAHINPLFLAALQQQQQQQYQQPQQQYQQPQQAPGQAQPQPPAAMNFDQVKAQLDLLRQLSNANQGPPPS
jgi:H/ACA ribonucleoprotein complex non-core subunit NAF1